ncbi:glycosyltransferase family 4 protein [Yinghuangia soli]|uniref:D-inositol 3-phosphate glycosyltransferase n=1 Tax=Yinghuangia soli TaxID=2908204 RepID=A0AA41Q439_9ACTN|nr:glycosyltransferase family 4 protein [Yinghuangia soli]MCF2529752.1 glycosyltransferase family 4 protein [Yinghuangia soli]
MDDRTDRRGDVGDSTGSSPAGRIKVVHVVGRPGRSGRGDGGFAPMSSRQVLADLDPARFACHVVTAHPVQSAAEVRKLRPDVLHVHSGSAGQALPAALAAPGAARVLELHEPPQSSAPAAGRPGDALPYGRLLRTLVTRGRFRPFAHSGGVRDAAAAVLGIPRAAIPLLPVGVDVPAPDAASRARLRTSLGVAPNTRLVIGVQRSGEPDFAAFVGVAAKVLAVLGDAGPAVAFAVVGRPDGWLRAMIEEAGIGKRVRIVPPLTRPQDIFDAGDIFLSTGARQGFGSVVAEAMCAGLAVAGPARGGLSDVLEDGVTGRAVRPGDLDALAFAVRELVADDDLRAMLGYAARQHAQARLTRARMVEAYADLYTAAARGPVGTAR